MLFFLGKDKFSVTHHQILNIFAAYVKEYFSLVRQRRLKQAGCIPKFNCFPGRCHSAWQEIDTVSTLVLSNCPQTRCPLNPSPKTAAAEAVPDEIRELNFWESLIRVQGALSNGIISLKIKLSNLPSPELRGALEGAGSEPSAPSGGKHFCFTCWFPTPSLTPWPWV